MRRGWFKFLRFGVSYNRDFYSNWPCYNETTFCWPFNNVLFFLQLRIMGKHCMNLSVCWKVIQVLLLAEYVSPSNYNDFINWAILSSTPLVLKPEYQGKTKIQNPWLTRGPFYWYGLTCRVKCGMKLLIHSQTSMVALLREWISNFIPHIIMDVITYPSSHGIDYARKWPLSSKRHDCNYLCHLSFEKW